MNSKFKKGIFWGAIAASTLLVVKVFHFLLGGGREFGHGHLGRGPGGMGQQGGGFGQQAFMNGPHHGGGFPWLFLIIGIIAVVLLVKWLRKKSSTTSMSSFIDATIDQSHIPVSNQNARMLDQWEKNVLSKKESE